MDIFTLTYGSLALIFSIILIIYKHHFSKNNYDLPPTPAPPLPIFGHLHLLLKPPLHRTLHRFSQTHGPIFSLRLGSLRTVVVSSPHLVQECFNNGNDIVFSNRPRVMVNEYVGYNHTTMAAVPYGHQWRRLRRMGAQEVLSSAQLNAFSEMRQDEVRRTLQTLMIHDSKVELRPKLFQLIFNIIMRMLAGKRYCGEENDDGGRFGKQIHEMVKEVFEQGLLLDPKDFLPFLEWIDYGGLKKKLEGLGRKLDEFYQGLLEEHRHEQRNNTVIGHLLSLQQSDPQFYTDQLIKGFITDMITAGTDTSIVSVEWDMSLLLNHPDVLEKARQELDSKVGHQRLMEEQDLPNLSYLRNIIMESSRLLPAAPLSVPRQSSADCTIGGYCIPRGTILIVNAWAIHRDPTVWSDPTSFKPERFQGKDQVETHKLMPFGIGRRACPGAGLGQRMVGLVLGSLIQCFEWERVGAEEVDLTEGVGLTMPKLEPLEAIYRPREIMIKLLQEATPI